MIAITFLGIAILIALSIFQALLITGRPLGSYAWGGQYEVLPQRLRIASVFSIVLYVVFGIFLASKAGLVSIIPHTSFLAVAMWVFTCYFVLGIFMNAISHSKKERALMTPVALALAVIFLLVTLS
ncbi:MAG TPA: hypothetical protein VFZ48_05495 [Candidatus Saccharimonadales bacterium]